MIIEPEPAVCALELRRHLQACMPSAEGNPMVCPKGETLVKTENGKSDCPDECAPLRKCVANVEFGPLDIPIRCPVEVRRRLQDCTIQPVSMSPTTCPSGETLVKTENGKSVCPDYCFPLRECMASGTSVGDPITTHNNVSRRYWLPTTGETLLLAQGVLEIYARAGPAPGNGPEVGEWIHTIRVSKANKTVVSVNVNPVTEPLGPALSSVSLQLLNVSVAGRTLLQTGTGAGVQADGVSVSAELDAHHKVGAAAGESVRISQAGFAMKVLLAKAQKFATEAERIKHVHLDLYFDEVADRGLRGALPEIWGLAPLSSGTKALLNDPAKKVHAHGVPWAMY